MAGEGDTGDRCSGTTPSRTRVAGKGRGGNESTAGGGADTDLPAEPARQDALRRVSPPGATDHEQLNGVGGEAGEPAGQGHGEVLVRRGRRSDSPVAGGSAQ